MSVVKVSSQFKAQAYKAVFSIILFTIVYFLFFLLSVGIFVGCCYAAAMIVAASPAFITIMLGIGLLGVGFFVMYFMIKFLFTKNKSDYSHLTEINIKNEPKLYQMIQDLVNEVETDFPKKVYLSSDVNASVFYDSSFWSMFFPVKKNLNIGMGLVNTSTVVELRGILAHEFGHFSQKSMRVGSYVYNVNRVIYNLLYDNDEYSEAMTTWASRSGYFALLIGIAIAFNKAIQYVLQFMYKIVNVSYMGLSREMEFHADEIAANVVGSEPMIHSMMRMNLTSDSFDRVLNYYESKINDSITTFNVYPQHLLATNLVATQNKIEIINNLPLVKEDYFEKFNKTKLIIKNQWASHPSTEERILAFKKLNIVLKTIDNRPANVLFKDIIKTQKLLTKKMFQNVEYPDSPIEEDVSSFLNTLEKEYVENKFPDAFNGYYDNYSMDAMDLEKLTEETSISAFEELFSNEKIELVYANNSQINDLETLKQIANKEFELKSFDYDGNKYKASEAQILVDNLNSTIENNKKLLRQNDNEIFKYFYQKAKQKTGESKLVKLYKDFILMDNQYKLKIQLYIDMINNFSFAYQQNQPDVINRNMKNFYGLEEKFKTELKSILNDELYQNVVTNDLREKCNKYLDDHLIYFGGGKYDDEAINSKNEIQNTYLFILQQSYFLKKKEILELQDSLR
ncbi:M48 family metalloprotease [Flavobacterium sangjuense]|uniref:Protease HtpX n=1 Tax=Flavobacterium sangjuense TaxID=2518177 RepID=A0A4P7PW96_9FLAO|nr:M48 family metalloprotease [Flavobacterium sangjuense]QBZ98582.1 Protease HtpX [Flavobacterium sangjuense]